MTFARTALALTAVLAAAASASAAAIDHLHIEANEGGSSGGHAALRFGDTVYHYQNVDGLLLLVRDDAQRFLHDYALLENRPIHVRRIAVSDEAAGAARERFQTRQGAQRSHLDALAALRAERALLERLRARSPGSPQDGLAIPGAGFFETTGSASAVDPALAALRAQVVRERGAGFFARRRADLRAELAALAPDLDPTPAPALDPDAAAPFAYGFGARYADGSAALVALDVLEHARPLRTDALREPDPAAPQLAQDERRALRTLADALRGSALRLLDGSRPDWGPALLIAMARVAALDASLRDGRLRVLDAYPDGEQSLDVRGLERDRALLRAIARESGAVAGEALRVFAASDASQAAWADVEDAANRHAEVLGAWRGGRAIRAAPERLVPARAARIREPVALDLPSEALALALERERALETAIGRLHAYHLLTHNCVSELFATLNAAFGDPARSTAALGGHVDGRGGLAFIPFVSAQRVGERYRIERDFTVPSLRRARLARMREGDAPLLVGLREASPLTARAVRPGARDSFFLFYTDGAVWPRPILGALNLVAGAGETVAGLLAAPVDRGRTLVRGLRGALMSLPELAFVNLRKGTTDWTPRDAEGELGIGELWGTLPRAQAAASSDEDRLLADRRRRGLER